MTQRYDKAFKILAGDDPRALLALLAGLPLDAEVHLRELDREVVPQNRLVDHAYEITNPDGGRYIVHFEATTRFRREVYERAAWQVYALVSAFGLPVRSYFVMLTAEAYPVGGVAGFKAAFGSFSWQVQPEIVCMWEIPGEVALAMNRPSLYPWITLLQASEEQQLEAVRRVVESGDRQQIVTVALLSELRYRDKGKFLGRFLDVTVHELFEETELYQSILARGEAKGVQVGLQRGMEQGEQALLLRLLQTRFGTLSPELERRIAAADRDTVERWGQQLLTAQSIDEALA